MAGVLLVSCGRLDYLNYDKAMRAMIFPSAGGDDASAGDVISASTNRSDKDEEKAPKLNAYEGAAFVKPPQINNYGTVTLSYAIDVPPGRAGVQPGVGLSYSSSGGDGLAGIGWSLSTGLGVISRTTKNGQLFYDYRDTFTFNGQRLVKVSGPANSENGLYRLEIESGFSKFVLSGAESGGVWRVIDKAGTVTVFGEDASSRIYRPDDETRTYIWNFTKSVDLNGNSMTAEYDDSAYDDNNILYLKEIRYTGNEDQGAPARQFVRFAYRDRDEAYVSKAPGFMMKMDRLIDRIVVGWDDPRGWTETVLWSYRMVYGTSADSGRPLLLTVESDRNSTKPEFIYQPAVHAFTWARIENTRYNDPEENPDSVKYFEGDFNGDGISDMVFFNPASGDWRAMEGKRDGGYLEKYYGNRFRGHDGPESIQWFKGNVTGDYNGDGRSDIAFYLPRTREFWVAEHTGKVFTFRCYGTLLIPVDIFKCEWFTGDFDGNGLSDSVLYHEPTGEWYLMANMGGHFSFIKFSETFQNLFRSDYDPDLRLNSPSTADTSDYGRDREKIFFLSGDYNGDGRTDISFYDARSGRWWVGENYRDDAIGFRLQWRIYKEFTEREKELFAPGRDSLTGNDRFSGDFNGDGLSDFLTFHRDRGEWILGDTGNGTINFKVFSRTPQFSEITRWLQGDFNGDGRTDIGFFSARDNNFWIGEATATGFRYRIYNNLAYGPDPARVMATPLPRDEVKVENARSVISGAASNAIVDYQFDGNYHSDRGEKALPGFFSGNESTAGLLIYRRRDKSLYLKAGQAAPAFRYPLDLDGEGVTLLNPDRPHRYRMNRDGLLYYAKTSSFGSDHHAFTAVYHDGGGFVEETAASFDEGQVTDFSIAESVYLVDRFTDTDDRHVLILDDRAETPRFMLFTGSGGGQNLAVQGLSPDYFRDLRNRKSRYRFFSGPFTGERAGILFVDMNAVSHRWYLGRVEGGHIVFTLLSGTPQFVTEGCVDSYRVIPGDTGADLVYANNGEGSVGFRKLSITASSISQTSYAPLARGIAFKGEFDAAGNPVLHDEGEVKRAILGSTCRLETLAAPAVSLKRPDLLTQVYPFQWIQGDYNGDGKTDIGIFHMKERYWYFALTMGTVPDLISTVKNGIGGLYRMTYENSTRFDNTDDDGIPRLPMNYKVCDSLTVEDGRGGSVLTSYGYAGGYAFSAFINGEKETDYFGFGHFTVTDAVGRRTVSEYYNVPFEDFRMNRALAGAVKRSRSHGSDQVEYERTEHDYTMRVIAESPAQKPSFLIEPTEVRKYMRDVLTETRRSSIELEPNRYEMTGRSESVTDHYSDDAHEAATATSYSRFENIESTNEMRLEWKASLQGTPHETTANYEYDDRGNLTRETTSYTGSGLAPVADRVMEYDYDGYGNRIRETNASGSPARVTEKSYDEHLHQFVTEERARGDRFTLVTGYAINYQSAFGGIDRKTDPNGKSTYFEYDALGRLARERIDADSGTETLQEYVYSTEFPLSAKVTQYVGPWGSLGGSIHTRAFVDGMGRVIHTVRSATEESGRRYVKSGMIVYDAAGRPVRKSQSDWCGDGEIDAFTAHTREKYPTLTEYHPSGRVSRVVLPEGYMGEPETSIRYTYHDPWETVETHSVGRTKRTVKNARGLVLYVEDSGTGDGGGIAQAKMGFAYDIAGNRVKKMDLASTPLGSQGGMTTDVPLGLFTPGAKDRSGNNVACWQYNAFGQMVHASDPDLGYAGTAYTPFGEAASRTDALGRVTTYEYDRLGRLTAKHLPGAEGSVAYLYDSLAGSENGMGRMVAMDDPAQRKEFSYDSIGRVKRETRRIKGADYDASFETRFEHDLLSRKKRVHYPVDPQSNTRLTAEYSHNAMGVTRVRIMAGSTTRDIIETIEYNEFGQMAEVRRGNNTVTRYDYDIKGRMEALLTSAYHNGQTWKVQDVRYEFRVDNSIAAVENTPDVGADGPVMSTIRYEYAYDGLNRLVHARGSYEKTATGGGSPSPPDPLSPGERGSVTKKFDLGYAYAPNGNMTGKTVYDPDSGAVEDAWSYSYDNHAATAISTTKAGARFAMEYDAAGNMIRQADGAKDMAKQMAYDSYNRIRSVTDEHNGNLKGQYWYDDQGFRVRRLARQEIDGREQEVELLYPSMYFAVEAHRNGHGRARPETACAVNNIYLNGVRIAAALPDGQARYYLTDQVDSVKVVTDDRGLVLTSHEYLPFGESWITEGDDKNAPKYNSQELDKESGYYFYNARHYDPEIARFVTPDTVIDGELSTQGWNRYSYCHNNPIIYRDPTGHGILDSIRSGADSIGSKISSVGEGIKSVGEKVTKPLSEMGDKFRDSISPKVDKVANWCNKNPKTMLAVGLGGGLAIAAAPAAPLAISAIKGIGAAKGIDMAIGAVQGLLTYGATTPAKDQTLQGVAISTVVGAATGLVSNVATGLKMIDKAPAVIKALSSGAISGGGNFAGQVASGKDVKDVSAASVGWVAATSGFGSYLSSATNLAKPASDLVGKGAMLLPRISGAAMIKMAEKQLKKE